MGFYSVSYQNNNKFVKLEYEMELVLSVVVMISFSYFKLSLGIALNIFHKMNLGPT